MTSESCNVRVVCRFRPLNGRERALGCHEEFISFSENKSSLTLRTPKQTEDQFTFDYVFGGAEVEAAMTGAEVKNPCTQQQIYDTVAAASVAEVTKGYQATIFAYGQTGSGKTFTMFGPDLNSEHRGVIPRVAHDLFAFINGDREGTEFQIKVTYLEIYKEMIRDLLNPSGVNLKVRETPQRGVWVEGLEERWVDSPRQIMELIEAGDQLRAKASTEMNSESSRSHSLVTITLVQKASDGSEKIGKLNLADLAGSEKVGKTGATGNTLEEAKKINQSLSALGNCINALAKRGKRKVHIPYRDSKLTFVLRDSLGGNSKTTLVINCSPHYDNVEETLSTLRFGKRAKTIQNKVKANINRSVAELNTIIARLQSQLAALRRHVKHLEALLAEHAPGLDPALIKLPERRLRTSTTMEGNVTLIGNDRKSKTEVMGHSGRSEASESNDNEGKEEGSERERVSDEEEESEEESDHEEGGSDIVRAAELHIQLEKLREQSEYTTSELREKLAAAQQLKMNAEEQLKKTADELMAASDRMLEYDATEKKRELQLMQTVGEKEEECHKLRMDAERLSSELRLAQATAVNGSRLKELEATNRRLIEERTALNAALDERRKHLEEVARAQEERLGLEAGSDNCLPDREEREQENEESHEQRETHLAYVRELTAQLTAKQLRIEALERELEARYKGRDNGLAEEEEQLKSCHEESEANHSQEANQSATSGGRRPSGMEAMEAERERIRLEIALEGEQRLLKLQEQRSRRLQERVTALEEAMETALDDKQQMAAARHLQQTEYNQLQRKLKEVEAKVEETPAPKVRIVKPIRQHRSLSVILGSRRKRELPRRESLTNTLKEGYLLKQGEIFRTWRKRWFVLKANPPTAYYFEKPESPEPKGSIPLDGCVVQVSDRETKRSCTFAIYHQSRRTFYVQAGNAEEREEWMDAMARLAEDENPLDLVMREQTLA